MDASRAHLRQRDNQFYINGLLVASSPETSAITTSTNPLFIGGDQTQGQYFNGLIDEVRVYNVALTQGQIQADMNTPIGSGGTQAPSAYRYGWFGRDDQRQTAADGGGT